MDVYTNTADDEDVEQIVFDEPISVNMDALIFTESGGDPTAVADGGRSKGLCQISKAAWEDVSEWRLCRGFIPFGSYEYNWMDPEKNRIQGGYYVNRVIPEKYFKAWNIVDSVEARLAAYKMGPVRFRELVKCFGLGWLHQAPSTVQRDIKKYHQFLENRKSQ